MKNIYFIIAFFLCISIYGQIPATDAIIKSETWVAQENPPNKTFLNKRYLDTDDNYYKWNGVNWVIDNLSDNLYNGHCPKEY